jgi:hypothetical protein
MKRKALRLPVTIGVALAVALLIGAPSSYAQPGSATTPSSSSSEVSPYAVISSSTAAWGLNDFGQLGNGTSGTANNSNKAVKVSNLSGMSTIAAGAHHSLAS